MLVSPSKQGTYVPIPPQRIIVRAFVRERHAHKGQTWQGDHKEIKRRQSKYFVSNHGTSVLRPWLGIQKQHWEKFRIGYNPLGFMMSVPVTAYHVFPKHLWKTWILFTLGLPSQDDGMMLHKSQCLSCHQNFGRFSDHALTCKHAIMLDDNSHHEENMTVAWTRAHDYVVDALGWCMLDTLLPFSTKFSGIPKYKSEKKKSEKDKNKENSLGDVWIGEKIGGFEGLVGDFTMCHPRFGSSQAHKEGEWRLDAMDLAIKGKNNKHLKGYNIKNRAFVALVSDTYGVLSDDLVRFLWLLAHRAAEKSDHDHGPMLGVDSNIGFVRRRSAKYARVCTYMGVAIAKAVVARIVHNSTIDSLEPFLWDSTWRNTGKFDVDGDLPVQHAVCD